MSEQPPNNPGVRTARRAVLVALLIVLLGAAAYGLLTPVGLVSAGAGGTLRGDARWPPGKVRAPDFRLRDQSGHLVSLQTTRGRPTLVAFMYSHCRETCPVEGELLGEALRAFIGQPRQPALLVVTVDPGGDTRTSIREFALRWGWTGDWHWLGGSRRELAAVWRAYRIEVLDRHTIAHSGALYLLDERGYERAGFVVPFLSKQLVSDLRLLVAPPLSTTRALLLGVAALLAAASTAAALARTTVPAVGSARPRPGARRRRSLGIRRCGAVRGHLRVVERASLLAAAGLVAAAVLEPALSPTHSAQALIAQASRRPAPSIASVPTLVPPVDALSAYRGRVVLLNFWASWCYPCQQEAPALMRFASTLPAKSAVLLGVDVNDQRSAAVSFLRAHHLGYPGVADTHGSLFQAFSLVGLPTTVVVDPEGRVAARLIGPQTDRSLRRALTQAEQTASQSGRSA